MTFQQILSNISFNNLNYAQLMGFWANPNDGSGAFNGGDEEIFVLDNESAFIQFVNNLIKEFGNLVFDTNNNYTFFSTPNFDRILITSFSNGGTCEIDYHKHEVDYRIKRENNYFIYYTDKSFKTIYYPKLYNYSNNFECIGFDGRSYPLKKDKLLLLNDEFIVLADTELVLNQIAVAAKSTFFFERSDSVIFQDFYVGQITNLSTENDLIKVKNLISIDVPFEAEQGKLYKIEGISSNFLFFGFGENRLHLDNESLDLLIENEATWFDREISTTIIGNFSNETQYAEATGCTVNAAGDEISFAGLSKDFIVNETYFLKVTYPNTLFELSNDRLIALNTTTLSIPAGALTPADFTITENQTIFNDVVFEMEVTDLNVESFGELFVSDLVVTGQSLIKGELYYIENNVAVISKSALLATSENTLSIGKDLAKSFLEEGIKSLSLEANMDLYQKKKTIIT